MISHLTQTKLTAYHTVISTNLATEQKPVRIFRPSQNIMMAWGCESGQTPFHPA